MYRETYRNFPGNVEFNHNNYRNLRLGGDDMSASKTMFLREEYISRINRVQDYIESNISEEFSLSQLSQIANFSPFHFHRIFLAMTGETLFQFIQRVRLEKAAFLLLNNKKLAITEIALECGFSNQASFAKAFKKHFGMCASSFRSDSNMGKVLQETVCYNNVIRRKQCCERQTAFDIQYSVEVKEIPETKVIYIRHTGSYKGDAVLFQRLFNRLGKWADKRGLIHPYETKWLTLFHNKLDLVDDKKIRISICMTVSQNVVTDGEIGSMEIPGGKYAIGHFKLNKDQYQAAWEAMSAQWLPESGYQPDDRMCFEFYPGEISNSDETNAVDIYIPVKPL